MYIPHYDGGSGQNGEPRHNDPRSVWATHIHIYIYTTHSCAPWLIHACHDLFMCHEPFTYVCVYKRFSQCLSNVYTYIYDVFIHDAHVPRDSFVCALTVSYGVATVSRIDCRILSLLGLFCKKTYDFIDATNQSRPVYAMTDSYIYVYVMILAMSEQRIYLYTWLTHTRLIHVRHDSCIYAMTHSYMCTCIYTDPHNVWATYMHI